MKRDGCNRAQALPRSPSTFVVRFPHQFLLRLCHIDVCSIGHTWRRDRMLEGMRRVAEQTRRKSSLRALLVRYIR